MVLSSVIVCDRDRRNADDRRSSFHMIADERRPYCDLRSAIIWKPALSAKAFHMKISFVCIRMKTNFHNKNFALSLAFIMSFTATRKWPIEKPCVLAATKKGTSLIWDTVTKLLLYVCQNRSNI